MRFDCDEHDDVLVVSLAGRLDSAGVMAIELPFTARLSAPQKPVLIDLGAVEFVASLGLRLLITLARTRARGQRRTILYGAGVEVADILATSGLDEIVPVVANAAEARAAAA